jgi:L-threonylcarbamoyladenylate synthase
MITQKIAAINSVKPESVLIAKAGQIIRNNGIVIFPAQCLYGIATNALDENAVRKVFHLKQRPLNNPLLILIPDITLLPDLVKSIPEPAQKLMDAFWPGNLTIIFNARNHLSQLLTAGTKKIGIRIPSHPVARALVEHVGFPITGTSANLSGQESCTRINRLAPTILDHTDLVLDAGKLKGGAGSSIVDVTVLKPNIIREGMVSIRRINKILAS